MKSKPDELQKLKIAKVILLQNQPFYASLLLPMTIAPDDSIATAQTDGKKIFYSPAFFASLSTQEVAGVLAHEVLHIANLHHTRLQERELERWNYACDYAINPLLLKSGLVLPAGCLNKKEYRKLSAERIYALLPPTPPDQAPRSGLGDIREPPPAEDLDKMETLVKHAVAQAALDARLKNNFPEHLERLVQELLKPNVDWKTVLASFLMECCRSDYSWKRPSPRYVHSGLYLPILESNTLGEILLIVDTSSSIMQALLNQFASEVQEIATAFSIPLQVLYVDDEFQGIQEIEADEPYELKPKGGGCTDFRPGFEYIEEQDLHPKVVIYLTDGECDFFPNEPAYPVLWAQFGACLFEPPFGEVIQVN